MAFSDMNSQGSKRKRNARIRENRAQSSKQNSRSSSVRNFDYEDDEQMKPKLKKIRPKSSYIFSRNMKNLDYCIGSPRTEKDKKNKNRRKADIFENGFVYFEKEIEKYKENGNYENYYLKNTTLIGEGKKVPELHYHTFDFKSKRMKSYETRKFLSRSDFPKFAKKKENFMSDKGIEKMLDISLKELGESWHENSKSYNNDEIPDIKNRVNFIHELNKFKEKNFQKKSKNNEENLGNIPIENISSEDIFHIPLLKEEKVTVRQALIEVEKRGKRSQRKGKTKEKIF